MNRFRFAPSPTGHLHIGTLRTALFNVMAKAAMGGSVVLRIEDTDLTRSDVAFEQGIYDGLNWLGLTMDEGPISGGGYGPYRQSERLDRYRDVAHRLLESGHAYRCVCTDEELEAQRQAAALAKRPYVYSGRCRGAGILADESRPYVLRFAMPTGREWYFRDVIRGDIVFDGDLLGDFVLVRSDGMPSYNFAVVVDDIDMKITMVIRGEDHISNTPKQMAIYEALDSSIPQFAHLPMILGPDKSKLSKRHGATNVMAYQEMGVLPEALLNHLMLLGWSDPNGREVMTRDEMVAVFSLERVSKSGAVFDLDKLKWMNGQYIRHCSDGGLLERVRPYLSEALLNQLGQPSQERLQAMVRSVRDNVHFLTEFETYLQVYTHSDDWVASVIAHLPDGSVEPVVHDRLGEWVGQLTDWSASQLDELLAEWVSGLGIPKGKGFKSVRWLLSGQATGPHLGQMMAIMGADRVIQRVDKIRRLV